MFLFSGVSYLKIDILLVKYISDMMIMRKLKTLLLIKKSWQQTLLGLKKISDGFTMYFGLCKAK